MTSTDLHACRGTQTEVANHSDSRPSHGQDSPTSVQPTQRLNHYINTRSKISVDSRTIAPSIRPAGSGRHSYPSPVKLFGQIQRPHSTAYFLGPRHQPRIVRVLPPLGAALQPASPSLPTSPRHPNNPLMNALALTHLRSIPRPTHHPTISELLDGQAHQALQIASHPTIAKHTHAIFQDSAHLPHYAKYSRIAAAEVRGPASSSSHNQARRMVDPTPRMPLSAQSLRFPTVENPHEVRELPRPARHSLIDEMRGVEIKVEDPTLSDERPAFSPPDLEGDGDDEKDEKDEEDEGDEEHEGDVDEEPPSIMSGVVVMDGDGRKIWVGEDVSF